MTIAEALKWAETSLLQAQIENAKNESVWMLTHVWASAKSSAEVLLRASQELNPGHLLKFRELIEARRNRQPLAYVLGNQEFLGLSLDVNADVLVPRPETEILAQHAAQYHPRKVLDVGTGSGNIAIALASLLKDCAVTALDVSAAALLVAERNAAKFKKQIRFLQSHFFSALTEADHGFFDVIVSNPPYIRSADLQGLEPEVRQEPLLALDGGEDGLDAIRAIVQSAPNYLAQNGLLILEVGFNQADPTQMFMRENGFVDVHVVLDQWQIRRVVCGKRRE